MFALMLHKRRYTPPLLLRLCYAICLLLRCFTLFERYAPVSMPRLHCRRAIRAAFVAAIVCYAYVARHNMSCHDAVGALRLSAMPLLIYGRLLTRRYGMKSDTARHAMAAAVFAMMLVCQYACRDAMLMLSRRFSDTTPLPPPLQVWRLIIGGGCRRRAALMRFRWRRQPPLAIAFKNGIT